MSAQSYRTCSKKWPPPAHQHAHWVFKTVPQSFVLFIKRKQDKKRESKTLKFLAPFPVATVKLRLQQWGLKKSPCGEAKAGATLLHISPNGHCGEGSDSEVSSCGVSQELLLFRCSSYELKTIHNRHQPTSLLFVQWPIGRQNGPFLLTFPVSIESMVLLSGGSAPVLEVMPTVFLGCTIPSWVATWSRHQPAE